MENRFKFNRSLSTHSNEELLTVVFCGHAGMFKVDFGPTDYGNKTQFITLSPVEASMLLQALLAEGVSASNFNYRKNEFGGSMIPISLSWEDVVAEYISDPTP